jgi:hypothetical protein
MFGVPLAVLLILALPFIRRDRRVWLGVATVLLFFVPLIFLPGRLFSAYWYVPLIGVAMALSSFADSRYGWVAAVFLMAWIPWNIVDLRDYRNQKLAEDAANRDYVDQLRAASASLRGIPVFLYHGLPASFPPWGLGGALTYLLPNYAKVYPMDDPQIWPLAQSPAIATLVWEQPARKLWVASRSPETQDAAYIIMNNVTPVWQLTEGWSGLEDGFRWAAPRATARLYRAPRATQFEVVLNSGPQLTETGCFEFSAQLNGVPLGRIHLTERRIQTVRWPLPPGPPGTVQVEFDASPSFHYGRDPRTLGAAVVSFGFLPSGR